MGAFTCSTNNAVDTITDIVAVKTGIIVNQEELISIISEDDKILAETLKKGEGSVRFRSEAFEELLTRIRFRMGDVKDTRHPMMIVLQLMIPWDEKGYDTNFWQRKILEMMIAQNKGAGQMVDHEPIINELIIKDNLPSQFVFDLFQTFIVNQERSNHIFSKVGDGIINGTPLQDLFNTEIPEKEGNSFIAQKFINYLAANPEKMQHIHWRNFERFCAEYFNKKGYSVELGSGVNDGGIDILIKSKNDNTTLIVVQCKRYKESNDVLIDTVKAFSTDVTHSGAKKGIIATTSRIAPGGKSVTTARSFPLEFIEANDIKNWTIQMHKPK
jgi:restriction system protein